MLRTFSRTLLSNHRLFNSTFNPQTPSPLTRALMSTIAAGKRVGTHNGSFHCDEALGCFMIRLTKKFSDAHIVRTRDPKVLETLDAVLDVGGVYDPSTDRYDHHQKGFEEVFGNGFMTKLSSAGLVYKHFGKEIIAKELRVDEDHPDVHRLFLAVYKSFMEVNEALKQYLKGNEKLCESDVFTVPRYYKSQAIDATDNGISRYDTDLQAKYVNNTHLSSRVGKLNLDWIVPDQSAEHENAAFGRAMALAGSEFLDSVRFHARSWLPARSIVMECLEARFGVDPSGEIMIMNRSCPWKLHLFELEEEMKINPPIKYVIYQDDRNKTWRVQAVAIAPDKFESRKALPAQWRGLRDDELSSESAIPGCVFVHMSGFIGGNKSYDGALAMAKAALKL